MSLILYHHGSHSCFLLPFEDFAIKGEGFYITDALAKREGYVSVAGTLE